MPPLTVKTPPPLTTRVIVGLDEKDTQQVTGWGLEAKLPIVEVWVVCPRSRVLTVDRFASYQTVCRELLEFTGHGCVDQEIATRPVMAAQFFQVLSNGYKLTGKQQIHLFAHLVIALARKWEQAWPRTERVIEMNQQGSELAVLFEGAPTDYIQQVEFCDYLSWLWHNLIICLDTGDWFSIHELITKADRPVDVQAKLTA